MNQLAGRSPSPSPSLFAVPDTEVLPDYVASILAQPPSYFRTHRPPQPLTYTFTNWAADSMLLMPPQTLAAPGPLYHISVALNMNPFVPISWVTKVRRGRSAEGEAVGEFELSLNQKRGIIVMGDYSTRLANVLFSVDNSNRHWKWSCDSVTLRWDCRSTLTDGSPMCVCFSTDSTDAQLASFIPPPIDASPPLPAAVLTVFPDGHEYFDHILMSALIIERKRTFEI